MTAMTQTFQPGELVNVQLRGVRYVRHEPDGALTVQTNDPDEHLWALPPQAAVERVAPMEWPPQPGDIWADRHGREYLGRVVEESGEDPYQLLMSVDHHDAHGSLAEAVAENSGPMRLVRRRGWTAEQPDAEPTPAQVDQRAKLVADLRAVAQWIEQHTDLPVNGMREHDMSVTYYAGSPSRLERVAELIGAEVTTDDAGHMHAVTEIDGRSYRAFHVPAAVLDARARELDKPAGPVPLVDAEPAGPIAPYGCDDCCAEPGEPHAWPGCPGAAANVPAEAGGETVEDAEVTS